MEESKKEETTDKNKLRKFFTKRRKLYLVNVLSGILFFICYYAEGWGGKLSGYWVDCAVIFILLYVFFTVTTIIVYYLSIIADSLSGKNKHNDSNGK